MRKAQRKQQDKKKSTSLLKNGKDGNDDDGETKEDRSHEERLKEVRKRLTMGKERRSLSRQQERQKYSSSTV